MLIACKCLNITVIAAHGVSTTSDIKCAEINLVNIQQQQSKIINANHFQFIFKKVRLSIIWLIYLLA